MNFIKRIISIILAICITTLSGIYAVAYTSNEDGKAVNPSESVIINEYEYLKSLSETDTRILQEKGYTTAEIEKIRDYREIYRDHICSLNQLTDADLKAHGYSTEQIQVIRNFNGTETEMILVSSQMTLTVHLSNFVKREGYGTEGLVYINFYWNGFPATATNGRDLLGIAWLGWEALEVDGAVDYYTETSGVYKGEIAATEYVPLLPLSGSGISFLARTNVGGIACYAKTGYARIEVLSDVATGKTFAYNCEYGQNRYYVLPSFSVLSGLDIVFSSGMETVAQKPGKLSHTEMPEG